jgi:hypothetical protein
MSKTISDESIVSALLSNGTIKAAAASLGISDRTIYDRMSRSEFLEVYKSAKADIVRQAVKTLNENTAAAIKVITDIMTDKEVNAATRLQAANSILNNIGKFADRLTAAEDAADNERRCGNDLTLDLNNLLR